MLDRLIIRDFVLVDRLELEFGEGFGAMTGETGAGKSILVDALAFVLGERADGGVIRAGCERTEVSAAFLIDRCPAALAWLEAHDMAAEDGLMLRRVLDSNGRSRAWLNGSPVTLQQIREVAESLVDIHGQHAHQSLLRPEAQRVLLDSHAGLLTLADEVAAAWRQWRESAALLDSAASSADAVATEKEQLEWQIQELDALAFSADDWDGLNLEHKRLAHAASLVDGARFSLEALSEGDAACVSQTDAVASRLESLAEFDPALEPVVELLRSASAEMAEAVSALRRYADRVDLDPQRLNEVERRIEAILACARKYRERPEALPARLVAWRDRLAVLGEQADLKALEQRMVAHRAHFNACAARLTDARREAADRLSADVSRVMQQLALGGGRFEIALLPVEGGGAYGREMIEFRIAGLAGGDARALARVASGGELSRISLAIQVVTSQAARVPTLVFDEVDVGIGGGVAETVGRLLRDLGCERQVLCVTHLPQVAACANWQWQVVKQSGPQGVMSTVRPLGDDERVEEIARMLGGVEITPITRQHAREMLGFT